MNKWRFLMPIGFLAVAAGFGAVIMLLWNWLMPPIFSLGTINFWQALGLLILCRLLFGNFRGRRHGIGMHGKSLIREKWLKMTPEQRKEFINKRMEHFAGGGFFGERNFDFDADKNAPKDDHE